MKRVFLILALIFTLIAIGMSMSVGIGFMTQFISPNRPFERNSLIATIFTVIAGIIAIISLIFGIIGIVKSKHFVLIAIFSIISGIMLLSCIFTPILHSDCIVYTILTVTSGIIEIIVGIVFLTHNMLINGRQSCQTDKPNNLKKQLKQLQNLYDEKILDEEEYTTKKTALMNSIIEKSATSNIEKCINKRTIIYSTIIFAVMIIYCSISLPILSSYYKNAVYNYIVDTIIDFDNEHLDSYFNYLPTDFKDTASLRRTYNKVEKLKYNITRDNYIELVKIQEMNTQWNLENILSQWGYIAFKNAKWKSSTTYYIELYDNESGGESLWTNLPNNMSSDKQYYFYKDSYSNPLKLGYKNQNDSSDKFIAYTISNLKYNIYTQEFSIDVLCSYNRTTYKMTYSNA